MRIPGLRLVIAGCSAAAVMMVVLGDIDRQSPGPLATVHGREPELARSNGCTQCHGGWFTSMAEACLDCHDTIEAQVEAGTGLHGSLDQSKAMRCALCHSDHRGPDFAVVNRQSFVQAGVPDVERFDHQILGFRLEGAHGFLACAECHANADAAVLPRGEPRFIGLQRDCSTCHEDPHRGRYDLSCAKCHGQQSFDQLESLGHERFLPLTGGHADTACRECHVDDRPRSLESLGMGNRLTPRECLDCHQSPHSDLLISGVAELGSTTSGSSCSECHRSTHESFRDPSLGLTPALHARSGFPLDPPHDQVACAECHQRDSGSFADAHPGRNADDCAACHRDPHGGQFEARSPADRGCLSCHKRNRFEPHAFTADLHARTAIELTGRHLEIGCYQCHKETTRELGRVFAGTPNRCENCHDDAHDGLFEERAGPQGNRSANASCGRCHETTSFSDVPIERFDHGHWTGFELRGAHAQAACESCHPRSGSPDESGRTFGRAADRFGTTRGGPDDCDSCHQDPHRGEFDRVHHSQVIDDRTGCARCHMETSFRAFREGGFDHLRWTGFPLRGAHGDIGCSPCHRPLPKPDEFGRTWGRAAGDQCIDCHGPRTEWLRRRRGNR